MKTCPKCSSVTFDDMDTCYDCMTDYSHPTQSDPSQDTTTVARLRVVLAGYFSYEMLLTKSEGRHLSIGSATDNTIVIPQPQVAPHQLEIFYARGQLWVETADPSNIIDIEGTPITDTRSLTPTTPLKVGDAKITLLDN
jgi:hypothetical protein